MARMVLMRCKKHPHLYWNTKAVAVKDGKYNGVRSLFFLGVLDMRNGTPRTFEDRSGVHTTKVHQGRVIRECECDSDELELAPENALLRGAAKHE